MAGVRHALAHIKRFWTRAPPYPARHSPHPTLGLVLWVRGGGFELKKTIEATDTARGNQWLEATNTVVNLSG